MVSVLTYPRVGLQKRRFQQGAEQRERTQGKHIVTGAFGNRWIQVEQRDVMLAAI